MSSPLVSRVPFEKQTPIASLQGLSDALAGALGELGVGGSDIATLLAEAVEAECILCRITVSGPDLISTGLHGDTVLAGVNEKLVRLRLGYCCRKGCLSSYYVVRFAPRPGLEWSEVWDRAQLGLRSPAEPAPDEDVPPRAFWRNLIPEVWVQLARKPITLGVVSLLVLVLFIIGGCRTGILHKSRVFIVSDAEHSPVHGKPPFPFEMHWDHEPTPTPPRGELDVMPAPQFPSWEGPGVGRFMESESILV